MASVASIIASVIAADPFHKAGMSSGLDSFEALVKFGMSDAPRHGWEFRARVARMDNRPEVWVDPIGGVVYREDFTGDFVAINV
jgi:hypothetical protein